MRFVIIGPGAIGRLVGGMLSSGGVDVRFLARSRRRADELSARPLRIVGPKGDIEVDLIVEASADRIKATEVVLVTVKAYDTAAAIRQHRAAVGDNTLVVSLQNGIGNAETLAEAVPEEQVLAASTTLGAFFDEGGVLHQVGEGRTLLGELAGGLSERVRRIAAVMNAAGVAVKPVDDIQTVLFTKLALNCAINPLTALLRIPNGELGGQSDLKALAEEIVKEVATVAAAVNVRLDAEALFSQTIEVCRLTAKNRNSMLKDVLAERQTEVDAINGAVCGLGEKYGIPTPVNATLARLIGAMLPTRDSRVRA